MTNYNHILHKATTLLLTAAAALSLCLLTGCNREDLPETGKYNVSVQLDTRAIDPSEVNSIVIFAFADVNDATGDGRLVGYLYQKIQNGQNRFALNLTEGGAIDFYVILNPDSQNYKIFNPSSGSNIVISSNIPDYKPKDIRSWQIKLENKNNPWLLPMSNLDGNESSYDNRRFWISSVPDRWQTVNISVTRAVSKVEVWFRSNDELTDNKTQSYSAITGYSLSDPVGSSELFGTSSSYGDSPRTEISQDERYYNNCGGPFRPYAEGSISPEEFYSEEYFTKIGEYYIFHNLTGGNNAGELSEGTDSGKCTTLTVKYRSYTRVNNGGWFWDEWTDWRPDEEEHSKEIYLPASGRNTNIRVWCALNDRTDRSFTYTVVDWDETVTINIPDFD